MAAGDIGSVTRPRRPAASGQSPNRRRLSFLRGRCLACLIHQAPGRGRAPVLARSPPREPLGCARRSGAALVVFVPREHRRKPAPHRATLPGSAASSRGLSTTRQRHGRRRTGRVGFRLGPSPRSTAQAVSRVAQQPGVFAGCAAARGRGLAARIAHHRSRLSPAELRRSVQKPPHRCGHVRHAA